MWAAAGAMGAFVTIVLSSAVLQLLPQIAQSPIGSYLFRAGAGDIDATSIEQSVYRGWLWMQHLAVFLSSPWIGVGSYDFLAVTGGSLTAGEGDTGSESFLTLWLSRIGLCLVPFLIFLWGAGRRAASVPQPLGWLVFIILGVALLAYGSFLVPYNFMFIVLYVLLVAPLSMARSVVIQPAIVRTTAMPVE
jgi:hypothetical protein